MLHMQNATSEVERAKKTRVMQRMNFSLKDSFKKRRCRIDILADILSVAEEKAKKTQIVDLLRNNLEKPGEWIPVKRSNMRGAMDALEGSIS